MRNKPQALRHACEYFAWGGFFAFNFYMETSINKKRTDEVVMVMRFLGIARLIS